MKSLPRLMPLAMIGLLMVSMSLPVFAQDRGEERGQERGQDRERGGDWRERWENMSDEEKEAMRERMRQRMAEREQQQSEDLRERLEMSEEDFEAIAPMIKKVRDLSREREMVTRGGGRGTPGQRSGGDFGVELSDSAKAASEAMAELRQAIADDDKGDIKSALGKLRKARTAMDKALKEAREELRSVCSAKWEAEFVVMGLLD